MKNCSSEGAIELTFTMEGREPCAITIGREGATHTIEERQMLEELHARIGQLLGKTTPSEAEAAPPNLPKPRKYARASAIWNGQHEPADPEMTQAIKRAIGGLTNREVETAHWISEGKSNFEIAVILGISRKTVEKHIENLYKKAGVESRFALMSRIHSAPRLTVAA